MATIHVLPPEIVSKIAAGEVIERPAFVIKELVENAIDAGATTITILVSKSGLESIIVSDNGIGMSADDLFLSWQKHTTSKLAPTHDLSQIATLGFRGEALASIAAVSELTIQSRQKSETGGMAISIHDGIYKESSPVGMAPGTIVEVKHVFANFPARKKFLSSAQTEWQHCLRVIEAQAVAYPKIRFVVTHNNRQVLDLVPQSPMQRMKSVLGEAVATQTFSFSAKTPYIRVQGFLGTPQLSFQTNLPSFLVVNQRVIGNKKITQAIRNTYRGLLKVEASPFYVLYLEVPSDMIDVNIHPRKEEIAFLNETELIETINRNIITVAKKQNFSFNWSTPKGDTASFAAKSIRSDVLEDLRTISPESKVLQLHNLYLVTETKHGILIIDQHAAHERILYDKLLATYLKKKTDQKIFNFSKPKKLHLPVSQMAILQSQQQALKDLGFTLEVVNPTLCLVHAVPELFQDRPVLQLFQELLSDLEQPASTAIDAHTNRMVAYLACRMAIKAGDYIDPEVAKQLLLDLAKTPSGYTCPHGRPTHIEMTLGDLEKAFGRK